MLGGMRYAQKFFRINFKFYKFLLGSLRSKSFKNHFKNLSFFNFNLNLNLNFRYNYPFHYEISNHVFYLMIL